jgi:hypothetical protein
MLNTTVDLNNYLFEQIERLQDDNLKDEDLERELKRSKAVSDIATQIVKNGELQLKAASFAKTWYGTDKPVPLLGLNT